jgi:phosphopantetheinyl transferase
VSIHRRVNKRRTVWIVRYRDPIPRERTFDRRADAERFERSVRHQLDTDQYLDPESAKVTFAHWCRPLVADHRKLRAGSQHDLGLRVGTPPPGAAVSR